jgi:D-alanyl-D-alanine carboxypeptidase
MWNKITSFILASLIPASVYNSGQNAFKTPTHPPLSVTIEPLAKIVREEVQQPHVSAKYALIIESHSNQALYAKNVWDPVPIASLTKLMTALVVKENLPLDQVITVSDIINRVGGSKMGLNIGEMITVEDLLKGLLIASGNDAAMVLSEAVAGNPEAFVSLMNERKLKLGLEKTQFVDPAGIQDGNVSSAFEIAHLAKYVFKDALLSAMMREKEVIVESHDGTYKHTLINTDRLLGTDIAHRILAGKTGTTPLAGQCLISFISNQPDRTTMTILLGSSNRYEDVKKLIFWVDQTFTWE